MLYQAIQIFHKGGWIMWPLLVLALAAIAVSIERTLAIRKAASDNDAFIEELRKRLNAADFDGRSPTMRPNTRPGATVAGQRHSHAPPG
jgi:biopolymer transport protein ExbB/TolQ